MPTTYSYRRSAYQIRCTQCGTSVHTQHPNESDAIAEESGRPVSETFRFRSRYDNFYSMCRECERARRAQATRTRAPRVPGTTRVVGRDARRFGVELEVILSGAVSSHSEMRRLLHDAGLTEWVVKYDGSLSGGGAEVVSPVLSGDDGIEQVRTACRVLRAAGATVNRSCGMHVHHEIRDLTIVQVKRLARTWVTHQDMIDGLVSPSRRDGANTYCRRIDEYELRAIESATDLRSLYVNDRYRTLNFDAYGRYGTVEVRQHQGTIDPEKIVSWLRFGQAVIESAATSTDEQPTRFTRMRDMLAALGDTLDETARTFLLGRAVEFGAVTV